MTQTAVEKPVHQNIQPQCDTCTQFVSNDVLAKGGSYDYVPDTPFCHERHEWRCPKCTKAHGNVVAYFITEFGW